MAVGAGFPKARGRPEAELLYRQEPGQGRLLHHISGVNGARALASVLLSFGTAVVAFLLVASGLEPV